MSSVGAGGLGTWKPWARKRPRGEKGHDGKALVRLDGRRSPEQDGPTPSLYRTEDGPQAGRGPGPGGPRRCTACDRVTRAPWEGSVFATLGRRVRSGRGFVDVLNDLIHLGQVRTIETEKRK